MQNKKPFIEFGEKFFKNIIEIILNIIFVISYLIFIVFLLMIPTMILSIQNGDYKSSLISIIILIINILLINIKRIGNLENPIYYLWRQKL